MVTTSLTPHPIPLPTFHPSHGANSIQPLPPQKPPSFNPLPLSGNPSPTPDFPYHTSPHNLLSILQVTATKLGQNRPRITCRKKDIHPEFYDDAKVYCSGDLVLTTGGTKKEYVVDVWSGNHPYYLGGRSSLMLDDDQVEKFRKKYAGLDSIMKIPVLKGEIIIPPRRKSAKDKKKK